MSSRNDVFSYGLCRYFEMFNTYEPFRIVSFLASSMLPFGFFFILDRVMLTISKEKLGTYLNFMLLSLVSLVITVFINISERTHTIHF